METIDTNKPIPITQVKNIRVRSVREQKRYLSKVEKKEVEPNTFPLSKIKENLAKRRID